MYKINEAAAMLGVDKIIIYEKLIHNSTELEAHTQKTNGITFIHEQGVELLRQLIYKNEKHIHREKTSNGSPMSESAENKTELLHRPQWIIDKSEIDKRVKMFSAPNKDADRVAEVEYKKKVLEGSSLNLESLAVSEVNTTIDPMPVSQGFEFSQSVGEIKQILSEKAKLKSVIAELRSGLIMLDSDIKRKDDAIVGYHKLMKEDLEWLWDVEAKLLKYLSHE